MKNKILMIIIILIVTMLIGSCAWMYPHPHKHEWECHTVCKTLDSEGEREECYHSTKCNWYHSRETSPRNKERCKIH